MHQSLWAPQMTAGRDVLNNIMQSYCYDKFKEL